MSLTRYETLPSEVVARQGKAWLDCDADDCSENVEVLGVQEATVGDRTYRHAPMPDGWVTNDPDDNALNGAAQFCPTHAGNVVKPVEDAPAPVVAPAADPE